MSYYNLLQLQELLFTELFACHIRAYGAPDWARVPCVVHPELSTLNHSGEVEHSVMTIRVQRHI